MKNKKLFAILTLVCFMFTLMPVAAFAATTYVDVDDDDALIKVTETATVEVAPVTTDSVYVFAVNANGAMYNYFDVNDADETATTGVVKVTLEEGSSDTFEAAFEAEGEYTIYVVPANAAAAAVVGDATLTKATKVSLLKDEAYRNLDATVKVKASRTDYHFSADANCELDNENKVICDAKTKMDAPVAKANGVEKAPVVLYLHNADGDPVVGAKVTISTNSSAVDVSKTEVTTDAAGRVKFDITATVAGEYEVYVEYGNKADVTVEVEAGTTGAAAIATKYNGGKVDIDTAIGATDMMFTITDINGNLIKGYDHDDNALTPDENPRDLGENGDGYYVKVVKAPAGSAVTNAALEEAYLWYYAPEAAWMLNGFELDEEGEYEFKVILDNGASAIANVTVSEFQTPVSIRLEYKAPSVELNGYNYMKDLKFIDANGVKTSKGTDEIKLAANGYAVDTFGTETKLVEVVKGGEPTGTFEYVTEANKGAVKAKADEKYVGSTITVTAVSTKYNLVATTSMVVANEASEVKYATTEADVAVNNTLTANIVDVDGNKVALNNGLADLEISYVVLEKPENSKVAVSTADSSDLAQKGQFKVSFTASEIGEYKVQTVVTYEQADGVVKYYTGIETITVGNTGFGDIVVMSVGSNEIVKNAETVTIDAAPIVENNRTFVPFRALAEAFGATVAFDEATQAVTAELNGTTVVMTIGSATYTVNGVEKSADVAPFINGSRTMVPVRFVAQAFGITVTPTYDDNGATADILFAK